jgi:hypothetical protein
MIRLRASALVPAAAVAAFAAIAAAAPAEARGVEGVIIGAPYYAPPPRVYYVAPRPVYVYGPPPVYAYGPPPVYAYPPPPGVVYAPPPAVYGAPSTVYAPPGAGSGPVAGGLTCREYQATATVGGRPQESYGTACLQPDGSWRIVR